jgi:hypothetical protein
MPDRTFPKNLPYSSKVDRWRWDIPNRCRTSIYDENVEAYARENRCWDWRVIPDNFRRWKIPDFFIWGCLDGSEVLYLCESCNLALLLDRLKRGVMER